MTAVIDETFCVAVEEISLQNAEEIKNYGAGLIQAGPGPFTVDLKNLQRANSITVAVLVAWYRHASLRQKSIIFVNLSKDLNNIIEFSGLSQVLVPNQ